MRLSEPPLNSTYYSLTIIASSPPLQAIARFPRDHTAFQGHFPANPILPGFMHVQAALDVLKAAGCGHALQQVSSARFLRPIPPEAAVTITLATTTSPLTYEVTLFLDDLPCSRFTLSVT